MLLLTIAATESAVVQRGKGVSTVIQYMSLITGAALYWTLLVMVSPIRITDLPTDFVCFSLQL